VGERKKKEGRQKVQGILSNPPLAKKNRKRKKRGGRSKICKTEEEAQTSSMGRGIEKVEEKKVRKGRETRDGKKKSFFNATQTAATKRFSCHCQKKKAEQGKKNRKGG